MLHRRDGKFINHGWTRINTDNNIAGWRGAPSQPEIHTPLQIFKEHLLTDIGGAAKSVSYIYRFLPIKAFSSAVWPLEGNQRVPKATKGHLKFKFCGKGLEKPVVFRSNLGLCRRPPLLMVTEDRSGTDSRPKLETVEHFQPCRVLSHSVVFVTRFLVRAGRARAIPSIL
jgi:hypothetical protein